MSNVDLASLNPQTYTLFDKVIRVYLYYQSAPANSGLGAYSGLYDVIDCPPAGAGITQIGNGVTGRKPTIRIKGSLVSQDTLTQVELRITNLYVSQPLSSYKYMRVEAGYRGNMQTFFQGQIKLAYQELPGPDSVTLFQLFLGNVDSWLNTTFSGSYSAGTPLSSVLADIAQRFGGLTVQNSASPSLAMKALLPHTGFLKDILPLIKDMFASWNPVDQTKTGIELFIYGNNLVCCSSNQGNTARPITVLDFITHAKHTGAGYEIQAPWIPALIPQDLVYINPKYFRQDFGGSLITAPGNTYQIYSIDFDFCTTDQTNTMTLLTDGWDVG